MVPPGEIATITEAFELRHSFVSPYQRMHDGKRDARLPERGRGEGRLAVVRLGERLERAQAPQRAVEQRKSADRQRCEEGVVERGSDAVQCGLQFKPGLNLIPITCLRLDSFSIEQARTKCKHQQRPHAWPLQPL